MLALLLAACLARQDSPAETVFKKIEETAYSAKSLRLSFRCDSTVTVDGEKLPCKVEGTLQIKGDDRSRYSYSVSIGGAAKTSLVVSNGTAGREILGQGTPREKVRDFTPRKGVCRVLAQQAVRLGLGTTQMQLRGLMADPRLSRFAEGEDEGKEKTLIYQVESPALPDTKVEIRLWYDPKTFLIRKRTVRATSKDLVTDVTETYPEYSVNPELPDETFKVPGDK